MHVEGCKLGESVMENIKHIPNPWHWDIPVEPSSRVGTYPGRQHGSPTIIQGVGTVVRAFLQSLGSLCRSVTWSHGVSLVLTSRRRYPLAMTSVSPSDQACMSQAIVSSLPADPRYCSPLKNLVKGNTLPLEYSTQLYQYACSSLLCAYSFSP